MIDVPVSEEISEQESEYLEYFKNNNIQIGFKDLLFIIGSEHIYQYRLLLILSILWFFQGLTLYSFIFMFLSPNFICSQSEIDQNSYEIIQSTSFYICGEGFNSCSSQIILNDGSINTIVLEFQLYCSQRTQRILIQILFVIGGAIGIFISKRIINQKIGHLKIIKISWYCSAIVIILTGFIRFYWQLIAISYFFIGFFQLQFLCTSLTYLKDLSEKQFFYDARIVLFMINCISQIFGVVINLILQSWRTFYFFIIGIPYLIIGILLYIFLLENPLFLIQKRESEEHIFETLQKISHINGKNFYHFEDFQNTIYNKIKFYVPPFSNIIEQDNLNLQQEQENVSQAEEMVVIDQNSLPLFMQRQNQNEQLNNGHLAQSAPQLNDSIVLSMNIDIINNNNQQENQSIHSRQISQISGHSLNNNNNQVNNNNNLIQNIDQNYQNSLLLTKKKKIMFILIGMVHFGIYFGLYFVVNQIALQLSFNVIILSVTEIIAIITAERFIDFPNPKSALQYNLSICGCILMCFNMTFNQKLCIDELYIFCPERIVQILLAGSARFSNIFSFSFLIRTYKLELYYEEDRIEMWENLGIYSLLGSIIPLIILQFTENTIQFLTGISIFAFIGSTLAKYIL